MNPDSSGNPIERGSQGVAADGPGLWRVAILVAAVCLAYANSFKGVFVMDDQMSIVTNPTIRSLSWAALKPPGGGITVEARPILNLSLALDYALSGTNPRGYHVTNLAIHLGAALALLGLLRRLLAQAGVTHASEIAWAVALVWAVHPLQTESVTYVVQRTESLMGLFYLGTLYCAVRGITAVAARSGRAWLAASVALCALGMGTKEVMVSAPPLALLIDRTFFAGTFAEAWRRRRGFHAALFATWLILAALVSGHLERGGTIGEAAGVTWWQYACTQARALVHYVRLSLWPHPLIFDYGSEFATFAQIWLHGLAVLAALGATFVAIHRRSAWGVVGAWFFFILAPTSSFVGGTRQMLAEHRMYLPLAAIVVGVVVALHRVLPMRVGRWACAAVAIALAAATLDRNADYHSDFALYGDNFRKRPHEAHSMHDYGNALHNRGQVEQAVALYEAALRLKPDHAAALEDLSRLLATLPNRDGELLHFYDEFLRAKPRDHRALNNAAVLLLRMPGRENDAVARAEAALRIEPDYPEGHFNLAQALIRLPARASEALPHYAAAVRLKPDYAEAHLGLGVYHTLVTGRHDVAVHHLESAVRLKPDWAEAHFHLAYALTAIPARAREAVPHYETTVRLQPDYAEARNGLGMLLAGVPGRQADAIAHLEAAIKAKPDYGDAHINLGMILVQLAGRPAEAVPHFEAALRADPNSAEVHFGLGMTLRMLGRAREAAEHFDAALKLRPDFAEARAQLEQVSK